MKEIEKNFLENIVNMFFPAVFLLVNEEEKKVWISRTGCLAEGVLRTLRKIRAGEHRLKNLDGFKLLYLDSGISLRYMYSRTCREYGVAGYELLNKPIKYRIKRRTLQRAGGYVTQVVLGTRNYDIEILGEFATAKEGEAFIKRWLETN